FTDIDTHITDTDIKIVPGGRSLLPGRLMAADINGDGKDDLVYSLPSADDLDYALPKPSDHYAFPISTGSGFGPAQPTDLRLPRYNGRPALFDFDMDGRADLISFDDTALVLDSVSGQPRMGTARNVIETSTAPREGTTGTLASAEELDVESAE